MSMELTLGPVLFEWERDELMRFYDEVAETAVDRVHLGEVVCYKKKGLTLKDMEEVGRMLEDTGKKVVVSTLAVVSNDDEVALTRDHCSLPFEVEASDMCVFNMVDATTKEVSAGPHILTYNTDGVAFLKRIGVNRITFPVELPAETIRTLIAETGVEAEVFAHGKVPLAFSWRCYTSRHHGRTKDECALDCAEYPDGLEVRTLDGDPAFTINGTSVLSSQAMTLVGETEELEEMGVRALRISPASRGTAEVVEIFKKRMDGTISAEEALSRLSTLSPAGLCNGWYSGRAGKELIAINAARLSAAS